MGLQAVDAELTAAAAGGTFITPSGMVLNGALDALEAPPTNDANADPDGDGVKNEVPVSVVDHMEFYLLNYFKAGTSNKRNDRDRDRDDEESGLRTLQRVGCTNCHVADLTINHDRRVECGRRYSRASLNGELHDSPQRRESAPTREDVVVVHLDLGSSWELGEVDQNVGALRDADLNIRRDLRRR